MSDSLTIDGVGPMPVERPATVAELCAIVRRCADSGTAIYPFGGGTMLEYGMPPARPGIALATALLNRVIDYPARDMTITVQAGITMQTLQDALAAEGQWLPIDVPDTEHATIGGAIACDVSGPQRYGYGTLRDYVIGITVVNDRGVECKAGGRVVKNVAGYDLMKLYTGSLGTLGIITQVTLKIRPKPEKFGAVWVSHSAEKLKEGIESLTKSKTRPTWWLTSNASLSAIQRGKRESPWNWCTMIGFESSQDSVDWQVRCLQEELSQIESRYLGGDIGDGVRSMVPNPPYAGSAASAIRLRANIFPKHVAEFCQLASAINSGVCIAALPDNGTVRSEWFDSQSWPVLKAQQTLERLSARAIGFDGRVTVETCPSAWKSSLPVWGRPPADIGLQKLIRAKFDPKRIFNPGRFVTDVF